MKVMQERHKTKKLIRCHKICWLFKIFKSSKWLLVLKMEVPVRLEGRRQEKGSAPTFIRGGIHLLFSQNVNQSRNSKKDATQVIRINITMKMGSRGPRDASSTNCPEFGDQLNGRTHGYVPCAMKKKGP